MKLLITLDFPPKIGGIQKYLYGIVRFRYNENDLVYVAGIPGEGCVLKLNTIVKYFHTFFDSINRKISLLLLLFPYLSLCKKNRGSLTVECGNIYAAFVPWLLFRITGQPFTIYTYGSELIGLKRKSFKNFILKNILKKAKKLYTLGKYSEKALGELHLSQQIDTVPPRIMLPTIQNTKKSMRDNECNILSVGRLVKHKGHTNLILAASLLIKESKFNFVIVGDGPEYKNLKNMCDVLNINLNVSIKQKLSDDLLNNEFSNADIFVLPSLETSGGIEGFGIVLLEAMAYHIPIIASISGGIPEVLDDGNCGLLIKPGMVEELVSGIRFFSKNPSHAQNLAHKAYERLLKHYVWK